MERRKKTEQSSISCVISVKVVPRSSKTAIIPLSQNSYKIKLTSPPVEGSANRQLVEVLAERLAITRQSIEIISGSRSANKRIKIIGISGTQQAQILGAP